MPTRSARFRPRLWPTVIALPAFLILLGLGSWQMDRLAWKRDLIAEREAALASPPLAAPPARFDPARHAGRRVTARGTFLHGREMYLGPRARDGRPGYEVVTPLILADGAAVLVIRGWVPLDRRDPERRAAGQPAGTVAVEGLMRASETPGLFTPDNAPAEGLWYWLDLDAMAAQAGLQRARPYVIEAGPAANPGGLPIGRPYRVELRNDHLQYAITWYALAAALAVIYILFHRRAGTGAGR